MKKYFSVFALIARSSLFKALAVILLTCAAQIGMYGMILKENLSLYLTRLQNGQLHYMPPSMSDGMAPTPFLFAIGLILITLLLSRFGVERQSRVSYTLNRLSVSARAFFLLQATYHVIVYLIFWMAEVVSLFLMCRIYISLVPSELLGDHLILLTFYTDRFMHGTLPLADAVLWVRNAVALLSLGICAAYSPTQPKQGVRPYIPLILAVTVALCWQSGLVDFSMTILITLLGIVFSVITIEFFLNKSKQRGTEHEEASDVG